jgi:hypothetical protein
MNICVSAYYFWSDWLHELSKLNNGSNVVVVSEKKGMVVEGLRVEHFPYGIDTGSFDYFVKHCYDFKEGVVFCHDDTIPYGDVSIFLRKLYDAKVDHAYVFNLEIEAKRNAYHHGRMLFMSPRMIRAFVDDYGGLPYDPKNISNISVLQCCKPYNYGIDELHRIALEIGKKYGYSVHNNFTSSDVYLAKRGDLEIRYKTISDNDMENVWSGIFSKYNGVETTFKETKDLVFNSSGLGGYANYSTFVEKTKHKALYLGRGKIVAFTWLDGDAAQYISLDDYDLSYLEYRIEKHYQMLGFNDVVAFGE